MAGLIRSGLNKAFFRVEEVQEKKEDIDFKAHLARRTRASKGLSYIFKTLSPKA